MGLVGKEALIVDDDKSFRILLRNVLKNMGINSSEAESIASAIQSAQTKLPHYIFLDLELSGEKGLEFLEKKSLMPGIKNIPVIVVTSSSDSQNVRQALALGAKDYMVKPVNSVRLVEKLKKLAQDTNFFVFELPKPLTLECVVDGNAQGVGEAHLQLRAPVIFAKDSFLRLTGNLVQPFNIAELRVKTKTIGSLLSGAGFHLTEAAYQDVNEETHAKIKKQIHYWQEIESNHPKFFNTQYPRIAMIDDDPNFCTLAQKIIAKLGIQVDVFSEPDEFLSYIRTAELSALLIDLTIGRARVGFKIVEAIRRILGPYIPIYIVSGESRSEVITEALELGCNGFIYKAQTPISLSKDFAETLLPKDHHGKDEEQLFLTPKDFAPVKIGMSITVIGGDEIGLKCLCDHLFAKNTIVVITSIEYKANQFTTHPLTFLVKENWIEVSGKQYGFYAEGQDNNREFSAIIRALLAKMATAAAA